MKKHANTSAEFAVDSLKDDPDYLECEKGWVFSTLMFVAGFYGTFTYSVRGGVFCNAQSANFVLFAVALGNGQWRHAAYFLIPMSAYLLGAIVSELVPSLMKKHPLIRWDTLLIVIEMAAVIILGFIPESAPYQISQVAINFICSMQYNTFRQTNGIPMATTFCTNHLRQIGISITKLLRGHSPDKYGQKLLSHIQMLLVFVIGGITGVILCRFFLGRAIWGVLIPLGIVLFKLLQAELVNERELLDRKPHGH